MALLIGMDEAGYGPNLGPLVISATAWEVPGDPRKIDLWEKFAGIIEQTPPAEDEHIQIADSKVVYSPARGLDNLETGVMHAMALYHNGNGSGAGHGSHCGASALAATYRDLIRRLAIRPPEELDQEPWFAGADHPVPTPGTDARGPAWLERCQSHNIYLRAICSDVVLTERFNGETRRHDSKGRALSEMSMQLLRHIWQAADGDSHDKALIIADKHGGRNRYHEFLPIVFGDQFIRCHNESTEQSRYGVGKAEIRFETKSERHLPVALASMVSKYLRELSMLLFNRFWTARQPGLKPTAGYPLDAIRFKNDIGALQNQLGIADEILWRER
jgi:hypothetical protein